MLSSSQQLQISSPQKFSLQSVSRLNRPSKSSNFLSYKNQNNQQSSIYCTTDNFVLCGSTLQIMNDEYQSKGPQPIIPVIGTYGEDFTKNITRSARDKKQSLMEIACQPSKKRRTVTARSFSAQNNKNSNILEQTSEPQTNQIMSKPNFASTLPVDSKFDDSNPPKSNFCDQSKPFHIVSSSLDDRNAARSRKAIQVLQRRQKRYDHHVPSFAVFASSSTVVAVDPTIDPAFTLHNTRVSDALIYSRDLPNPPQYIQLRYGDDINQSHQRLSQIELRRRFKEALENGEIVGDDFDYEQHHTGFSYVDKNFNMDYERSIAQHRKLHSHKTWNRTKLIHSSKKRRQVDLYED